MEQVKGKGHQELISALRGLNAKIEAANVEIEAGIKAQDAQWALERRQAIAAGSIKGPKEDNVVLLILSYPLVALSFGYLFMAGCWFVNEVLRLISN